MGKAFWGHAKRKYEIVDEQYKELIIKKSRFPVSYKIYDTNKSKRGYAKFKCRRTLF